MVVLLIGPKGAGKSTIREHLEGRGWRPVYVEALYQELDPKQEHTVHRPSETLRERVYEEAKDRLLRYAALGDAVYDGTGSSGRFDQFLAAVREAVPVSLLVFVEAEREEAWRRTQLRDRAAHRPFDRHYFDTIFEACQNWRTSADVIQNGGTTDELIGRFHAVLSTRGSACC